MTPIQWVAAGLLLVVVDAFYDVWDAVPDPLGWVLVLFGAWQLRRVLPEGRGLLSAAAVAAAASVVVLVLHADAPPASMAGDAVPAEGQWVLSLPQLVFATLLCRSVAERLRTWVADRGALARPVEPVEPVEPPQDAVSAARSAVRARNLKRLAWVFAALALVPPVVFGGGVDALVVPAAVVGVLAHVALLWWLVALGRHEALEAPPRDPAPTAA